MFVGENKRGFAAVAAAAVLLQSARLRPSLFSPGITDGRTRTDADADGGRTERSFGSVPLKEILLAALLSSLFRSDVYQTTPTHSGIISPLTISDGCTARTREALRLSLPLAGVSERQCGIHFIVNVQLSGFQFRKRGGRARARLLRDFQRRVLKFHVTLAEVITLDSW